MRKWLLQKLGVVEWERYNAERVKLRDLEQWVRDTEIETLKSGNRPARFLDDRNVWGTSSFLIELRQKELSEMYASWCNTSSLSQLMKP